MFNTEGVQTPASAASPIMPNWIDTKGSETCNEQDEKDDYIPILGQRKNDDVGTLEGSISRGVEDHRNSGLLRASKNLVGTV